ncbi:hypothetical protein [Xenophilus sp. Marseille-Q4582]|uniref:hypothetical protein n=1 Tax=Xenophilus sp. Marseille-Q4582 TaxID=2866600 RepID=UPI001CE4785B|nr:hypothetical protein [Xenophilus sp. Marseille-Q4582]
MDAEKIAALAELMGRKPSEVEDYVIGLSIFVNRGFTLEEAIHKLNAMWGNVLTAVTTAASNAERVPSWGEALNGYVQTLAEDAWDTVDQARQGPKLPKPRREWALI